MKKTKLFLVPTYLSKSNDLSFVSPMVGEVLKNVDHFLVENVRTARRFISSLKLGITIDELQFEVLDKRTSWDSLYPLLEPTRNGKDMALMSEAGLPCMADPGNVAVGFAHQTGVQVVPLPGSSSIQLALIGSGFNGQQFTFHGYLPIDKDPRTKKIRELEKLSANGYTQLFMETPYRNKALLGDIIKICRPTTLLSIAIDLTGQDESIVTQTIEKWKKASVDINKIPAIFSFGQFS